MNKKQSERKYIIMTFNGTHKKTFFKTPADDLWSYYNYVYLSEWVFSHLGQPDECECESLRLYLGPLQARGLVFAEVPCGVQGQHCIGGPGGKAPWSKDDFRFCK